MRQHRSEFRPQRLHHIRPHRHYHIMTHRNLNRAIILRRALKGEAPFGKDLPAPPAGATIKRMPVGFHPVPAESIAVIEQWIDDGCPDQEPVRAWRPTNAPTARRFDDIWFRDADRGWAANSLGQILHTHDGGATWVEQFQDEEVYFRCLGFVSGTRGWAGTSPSASGKRLLETSDGGRPGRSSRTSRHWPRT
jgi:hypothetical protein